MKNSNGNPLISVIVPVFNVEKYLEEAVNSLLNQTYNNVEIILIDDKSTDGSVDICDSYTNKYPMIKVVHKQSNEGLGMARNTGIEHARGKYIAFVDSDDYIAPDYLELHLKHINANGVDASYCGHIKFNNSNSTIFPNMFAGMVKQRDDIIHHVIPQMCGRMKNSEQLQMSSCMALYSLDIIKEYKIRFPSERVYISEDFLFNIDYLMHCNRVFFSKDTGYFYRYNEKSLTHKYLEDRLNKQKNMTEKIIEVTKSIGNYELCKERIYNTFLIWVRACIQMEQREAITNGKKKSIERIRGICSDSMVQDVLECRDNKSDRFASEFVNLLIRQKKAHLLFLTMAVKNYSLKK